MSDQIVLPSFVGNVVKKDGLCYEFVGFEPLAPTHTDPDFVFENCDACAPEVKDCACDTVGNPDYPRMGITLTFDAPGPISFLGCDFYSGIPKSVCASFYTCGAINETWSLAASSGKFRIANILSPGTPVYVRGRWEISRSTAQRIKAGFYRTSGLALSGFSYGTWLAATSSLFLVPNKGNMQFVNNVQMEQMGSQEFADGVVISWAMGPAGNTADWGC